MTPCSAAVSGERGGERCLLFGRRTALKIPKQHPVCVCVHIYLLKCVC